MIGFAHPPGGLPRFHPATLVATFFWVGRLTPASGTWGSLAAALTGWGLFAWGGKTALLAGVTLSILLGIWAAQKIERRGVHDPRTIVIDEVAGQWLTLLVLPEPDILFIALAFLLFRLFDVLKPWPIRAADRRIGGGIGVMVDDLMAAVAAAGCLWAILHMVA
ncbi:MAG: phosphatidylglycerophosphatase A [Azospirillaceae bacterium]